MTNLMTRYIDEAGEFRVVVIDSTAVGQAVFRKLQPSPIALQLVTQAMTGALMMITTLKEKGSLLFKFRGNGPCADLTVEANTFGQVRGCTADMHFHFDPKPGEGLFEQALGDGELIVKRKVASSPEVFTSVVPLVKGETALNFANFLLNSEQIRSGIDLGATLDPELGVKGAGGLLVQALPNATDETIATLEKRLSGMPQMGDIFSEPDGHTKVHKILFEGFQVKQLEETEVYFHCNCSRAGMYASLRMLPSPDIQEMHDDGKPIKLTCSFCGESYDFGMRALERILDLRARAAARGVVESEETIDEADIPKD